MRRSAKALFGGLIAVAILAVASSSAPAAQMPSGFRDSVVLSEVTEPTAIDFAADGHVFVALKTGQVLVYDGIEDQTPTVFADLRGDVYDQGDRGLAGLAVDPDFPDRPYVYVLYTYDHILGDPAPAPRWGTAGTEGDPCPEPKGADTCLVSGRLLRLTADAAVDHAVAEKPLVEEWCQQFSSHSSDNLEFGADGALYASGGDGASFNTADYGQLGTPPNPCGDPPEEGGALRAQDLRTGGDPVGLDGTLIRIDPDTGAGLPDNPLSASSDPNARRIVGYGFRNPFRFAIDPEGGDVYLANVGWNDFEEIDHLPGVPGQPYNSGWPCFEGLGPTPNYSSLELPICESLDEGPGGSSPPFFLYRHGSPVAPEDGCRTDLGSALSGITFYEGGDYPAAYDGALFFADSVRGCIFVMFPGQDGRPDPTTTTDFSIEAGIYPGVDLTIGPGGDLYYVKLYGSTEAGTIHRISYDPDAPVAHLAADPLWGEDEPLEVHLDASGSTDPQEEELTFAWDLDEDGVFETSGGANGKLTEMLEDDDGGGLTVAVRVTDRTGKSGIDRVTVFPGDTPPRPEITEPTAGLTWGVGQRIDFEGSAADDEDGALEDTALYWRARLYHCPDACHAHPLRIFPGVDEGSFTAPEHDYPSHIELTLTATDSEGLTATRTVSIDARARQLAIESDPPGIELSAGQVSAAAPFPLTVIDGSHLTLAAPSTATVDGREVSWSGWSDGGERVHEIVADGSTDAYVASYAADLAGNRGEPPPSLPAAAPSTRLVGHPAKRTALTTVAFRFSADRGGLRFRCKLDKGDFVSCRSPRVYKHLNPGRHAFRVFALDPVTGSADLSPARFSWRQLCPATRCRPPCSSSAAGAGRACR